MSEPSPAGDAVRRGRITIGHLPVDGLPRRAAARWPGRPAIRSGAEVVSFARLDDLVSRFAGGLVRLLADHGQRGTPVAVSAVLAPSFAVAFHGVSRSGNVITLINTLARGQGLAHLFTAAGVTAAVVPSTQAIQLLAMREQLPYLRAIIVLDSDDVPAGTVPLTDLLASPPLDEAVTVDLGAPACIQFTSGTTGPPKAVRLSHRNLTVNAAQISDAHGLDHDCVTVNHLPIYHLMHLNSALHAGAEQVLCADGDPLAGIELARRVKATHLYGLPARLARLATELDRIPSLAGGPLRGVFSGGSALAPADARAITDRLGVPAVQGYGLAELSPLTHCDLPDRFRIGSVGPPVSGTECRIVDPRTRRTLGPDERGEVLLRGPQLMLGYRDGGTASGIDADGWFATGDLGQVDSDGWLFLVDRIKDTFKCDNEIVSPTELERMLARHPAVVDCVVVDKPDRFSGAVAIAGVVPRQPCTAADLDDIRRTTNEGLPYYQHIRHIEAVPRIRRSPAGKVDRRGMREELRAAPAETPIQG